MAETFEVGESEKHVIIVDCNIWTKMIKVERDGEVVAHSFHPSPTPKTFEFDIGSAETHRVVVTVGPFHPAEVSVDGNRVEPLR